MPPLMYDFYKFEEDDGGRADAGLQGFASDCATRALSIALDLPYRQILRELTELQHNSSAPPPVKHWVTAEDGIPV